MLSFQIFWIESANTNQSLFRVGRNVGPWIGDCTYRSIGMPFMPRGLFSLVYFFMLEVIFFLFGLWICYFFFWFNVILMTTYTILKIQVLLNCMKLEDMSLSLGCDFGWHFVGLSFVVIDGTPCKDNLVKWGFCSEYEPHD